MTGMEGGLPGPLVAPAPPRYHEALGGRREDRLNYVLRIIGEGDNKLTILFVAVVGVTLVWWLRSVKPKRRV